MLCMSDTQSSAVITVANTCIYIIYILHTALIIVAQSKSDFRITIDTPYLTVMGELWGVCCEDFGEN